MIEVKRLTSWDDAKSWESAWNQLVFGSIDAMTGIASLFQTYQWNQAWWQAFGDGQELVLLGAFENGRLVGVAPFAISRKKWPIPSRVLYLIGGPNFASDYCALIFERGRNDVARELAKWVSSNSELWDQIDLVNWVKGSVGLQELQDELRMGGYRPRLRFICDAPTIRLSGTAADKEVTNKKSLKRHFNWFKNQGKLEYSHTTDRKLIESRLEDFFEQHIGRRSVAGTDADSLFLDPKQKQFYRLLIEHLLPKGWLRFFTVSLGDEALAYHFGFEFEGRYYWYKPSFNIKYLKKSPGEVLLKTLIEEAIERGLKEFDFTAGSESFKYRFSNDVRKLYRLYAFRGFARYAAFVALTIAARLKRAVNQRIQSIRRMLKERSKAPSAPPASDS